MGSVQNTEFHPLRKGQGLSGQSSRERHFGRSLVLAFFPFPSISLRPFAPPELLGFNATMNALTPERRLFLPVGSHWGIRHMNSVLFVQVSLLPVLKLLTIPSPTTCCRSRSLVWFLSETYRVDRAVPATPLTRLVASWASPLASWLATTTGRIEFVIILRTGHSLPVALHPASRRRSYVQLQRSNPTLTGTCTPPFQHHHKRTNPHTPCAEPRHRRGASP